MGSALPTATLENWRQHPFSVWGFTHVDSLIPVASIPTTPPPSALRQGKPLDFEATGLFAVCIQHEMDHLEGKVFVDYLSQLKRTRIRTKMLKQNKNIS